VDKNNLLHLIVMDLLQSRTFARGKRFNEMASWGGCFPHTVRGCSSAV